jgi:hypothetical protein
MPIYWKFEERNRSERQKFSESNDVGDERWTVLLGCTYKLTGRQGVACVGVVWKQNKAVTERC